MKTRNIFDIPDDYDQNQQLSLDEISLTPDYQLQESWENSNLEERDRTAALIAREASSLDELDARKYFESRVQGYGPYADQVSQLVFLKYWEAQFKSY